MGSGLLHIVGILGAIALYLFAGDSTAFVSPLALFTLLTLAYFSLVRSKLPGFFPWFAISYSFLFLVYPAIRPLLPDTPGVDPRLFVKYTFLAVTGCHLFMVGYEFGGVGMGPGAWPGWFHVQKAALYRVLAVLFLVNVLAISLKILSAGSFQIILSQSRLELKTGYGLLNITALYLVSFGAFFFPLFAALVYRQRHLVPIFICLVVILEFFVFVLFRTRTPVVIHLTGLMMGWFFLGPRLGWPGHSIRRVRVSFRGAVLIGMVLLVTGMSGLMIRSMRGQMELRENGQDLEINLWESVALGLQSGELNYSIPVLRVLDQIPEHYDYLHGQSYFRLLFVGIPRSIWESKPHNSQRILAPIINPGSNEVQTIPAGIFGDLYANFSSWGILGMFIFGWVFRALDRGSGLPWAIFLSVSFAMVFHFVRGSFTNPIITLLLYWVLASLLAAYLKPWSRSPDSR